MPNALIRVSYFKFKVIKKMYHSVQSHSLENNLDYILISNIPSALISYRYLSFFKNPIHYLKMINRMYFLFYLFAVISFKQIICLNVDYSLKSNELRNILPELEKMSTSLKNVESSHEKLITLLRNSAMLNGFKNRSPEDLKKNGYKCADGIGWHKLNTFNLTWNEARKACREDDAHLAVINSEAEAEVRFN